MGDGRIQLNIKFGGKFEGNPFHSYIDGDICYSRVIPYEFSYVDLVSAMQEIECHSWRSFFYLRPGHSVENGLSEITSDVDMIEMFVLYEGKDKDIECFVTHLMLKRMMRRVNEGEGVDGDEGGHLSVSNLEEDLGKGVIISVIEESDSSDENVSVVSSLDDEKVKKKGTNKMKCPEFNEERDMENPKLVEGMLFPNVRVFRAFLKEFHRRHGCQYKYLKNESRRWASAEWLAKKYVDEINDDPNWKVTAMQNDVRRKWMLDVSEMQIYRAKRKAIKMVDGAHGEQYHRLWNYCEMIRNKNPRSCAKLKVDVGDENN
ncbi:uncharacterized protein LOC131317422 [Rhododendron vialii]|uniref:uncharacterized protein LOC131317422 n=1 Tax=Rhododendron vialii TaxID=182163 RepID=UPI00265E845F|nr:uncharacterized protein LOC131317422 [Rhododendron vialii]